MLFVIWPKVLHRRCRVSSFLFALSFFLCLYLQFRSIQRRWTLSPVPVVQPTPVYQSLPRIPIDFTRNIPANICYTSSAGGPENGSRNVSYVIMVYSRPENFDVRQLVRGTWGSRDILDQLEAVVLFPVGRTTNLDVEERIENEAALHNDIIQGDFIDDYRNLSYKGVLMLKWFVRFCPRASFLVKVDADVFVNVFLLDSILRAEYDGAKRFLACKVHWRSRVLRPEVWCGKWCVPLADYRETFYPPYCWGTFYIMSTDLAGQILSASESVPFWWVDDVYLTGIIPRTLGLVEHIVFSEYLEEDPARLQSISGNHIIFALVQSLNASLNAWNIVKNSDRLLQGT